MRIRKYRRLGSNVATIPDLGKYMAVVSASDAKLVSPHTNTQPETVIGELRKGAYLGVFFMKDSDAFVILADGKSGLTARSNLRLLEVATIGRARDQ